MKKIIDIICDDAETAVDEETLVMVNEVENRINEINESIEIISNYINEQHNKYLQIVGHLIESTAISYIVFQISKYIIPENIILLNVLNKACMIIIATISSGLLSYYILKKILS